MSTQWSPMALNENDLFEIDWTVADDGSEILNPGDTIVDYQVAVDPATGLTVGSTLIVPTALTHTKVWLTAAAVGEYATLHTITTAAGRVLPRSKKVRVDAVVE